MSLEEYTPDESIWESWWWSNEKAKEMSEKFKEQVRKATAWIKRTQKDEWKAKKQDMLLANFLVKLILNKNFDDILELLFKLIDKWYPSNFLLWIISLIYIDISNKIREINKLEKIKFHYTSKDITDFDESDIDESIKERINNWVQDIILSSSYDYSSLLTSRLIKLLEKKENDIIIFCSVIFISFLKKLNIIIDKKESENISVFIIWEVLKEIKGLDLNKL